MDCFLSRLSQKKINMSNSSYIALAGLLVAGLSKMGWVIEQNDALTILSGLVAIYGVIAQHFANKALRNQVVSLGSFPVK